MNHLQKIAIYLMILSISLFTACDDGPNNMCDFDADVESNATQLFANEEPYTLTYEITDNSSSASAFTIYCYELECISNNDIGEVYSRSFSADENTSGPYYYEDEFVVVEPGQYRSVVYANDICEDNLVVIDELSFTIWYPQQFHPCE